jgi:ligand-binding sensor domain-containing protein
MAISTIIKQNLRKLYFVFFLIYFVSCVKQNQSETTISVTNQSSISVKDTATAAIFNATVVSKMDKNIRSIFQDKKGNYWFGTNGSGVYLYNGKTLHQFSTNEGLANNQIQSIQEDANGNIWFGTGVFGVSQFDGEKIITYTNKENMQSKITQWKIVPNDLWFFAGGGLYRYHDNSFVYLPLDKKNQSQSSPQTLSRYAVYSILKDKKGNIWFGTQSEGVCRFDGKSFTWFTEKGLKGPAVLGLFEDSKGIIWFGNNGGGLFRYDGNYLINFTQEKKLGNADFRVSGKSESGNLARVYAINEDDFGNIWIGTVDSGVWKYDGNHLINYTTKNGLTSNSVNVIYKDNYGELWFGTDANGLCKFNGKSFTEFVLEVGVQ